MRVSVLLSVRVYLLLSLHCAATAGADPAAPEELTKRAALNRPSARPDPEGTPTRVAVTVYLLDISYIDDVRQSFSADFVLRLRWRDRRLVDERSSDVRKLALGEVWDPQLRILNIRSLTKQLADIVDIDPHGVVTYRQRFIGQLAVPLDLANFPFDQEVLSIKAVSADYSTAEVAFVADEAPSAQADPLSISGWSIGATTTSFGSLRVPMLAKELALFGHNVEARRQLGYYIWKVLVPLILIVFMAFAVFWVDPANIGVQVALSTASILTLIAFYLHLSALLPQIPYPTRLDDFVLGSTVLVFFAFGEGIITSLLAKQGHESIALKIDLWMRWVFPLCFASITFLGWSP